MKNQQSLVLLNSSKLKTVLEFKLQGLQKLGHTEKKKSLKKKYRVYGFARERVAANWIRSLGTSNLLLYRLHTSKSKNEFTFLTGHA